MLCLGHIGEAEAMIRPLEQSLPNLRRFDGVSLSTAVGELAEKGSFGSLIRELVFHISFVYPLMHGATMVRRRPRCASEFFSGDFSKKAVFLVVCRCRSGKVCSVCGVCIFMY